MKQFYIQTNIGNVKYLVNFSDGTKFHKDGSVFFDIRIFKNKKLLEKFIDELRSMRYVDTRSLISH